MRDAYLLYLGSVRRLSPHTLESYGKDLEKYESYLGEQGVGAERAGPVAMEEGPRLPQEYREKNGDERGTAPRLDHQRAHDERGDRE